MRFWLGAPFMFIGLTLYAIGMHIAFGAKKADMLMKEIDNAIDRTIGSNKEGLG